MFAKYAEKVSSAYKSNSHSDLHHGHTERLQKLFCCCHSLLREIFHWCDAHHTLECVVKVILVNLKGLRNHAKGQWLIVMRTDILRRPISQFLSRPPRLVRPASLPGSVARLKCVVYGHHNIMATKHSPETVELVRRLAETMIDQQIAKQLNESGTRTPDGRMFTIDSIKWIRYIHRIPGYTSQRRGLSVKEAAERLRVAPGVVYYWLNRGILSDTKVAPCYLWEIHLNEQKELELRGRIQKSGHLN
jgi:hypothetical protein